MHTMRGVFEGVKFNLYATKHSKHVFQLLATYGSSIVMQDTFWMRKKRGGFFPCKRNDDGLCHYKYKSKMDSHNRYRQGLRTSLEGAWASKSWEKRHLAFVIGVVCLVNAYLAHLKLNVTDKKKPPSMSEFQHQVSAEKAKNERDCG